jgi:hypothetical protein
VTILLLGLGYFIYNFYVCHKKKVDIVGDVDEEDPQVPENKEIEF